VCSSDLYTEHMWLKEERIDLLVGFLSYQFN
jgi:hypothetical protein